MKILDLLKNKLFQNFKKVFKKFEILSFKNLKHKLIISKINIKFLFKKFNLFEKILNYFRNFYKNVNEISLNRKKTIF